MKVPLKLGDALFTVNLLLLLVFGTDVVLGFTGQHDEGLHCLIIKISGWSLTTTELAYVCVACPPHAWILYHQQPYVATP